jgi:hypothetical protein
MNDSVTQIAKAILALTYGELIELARSLTEAVVLSEDAADLAGELHGWATNRVEDTP